MLNQKKVHLWACALTATALCAATTQAAVVLQADFDGAGAGTGGAADIVALGGTATMYHNTVDATTLFVAGAGGYAHYGTQFSDGGSVAVTPLAPANSPNTITPVVSGDRVMNGGLDFFMRSDHVLANGEIRFFDILGETNGLRIFMDAISSSTLRFFVLAPTNGLTAGTDDGVAGTTSQRVMDASLAGGFTADTVYHVGVTFSTDVSGAVTASTYIKEGTGAIDLNTETATALVTFGIDEANTTGGLRTTTFFINGSKSNAPATHDMDTFRLYDVVPTAFEALVIPEPATLGLMGLGLLFMSSRSAKH